MDEELNKKVDELIDRLLSDEKVRNYFDEKLEELFMFGEMTISQAELDALEYNEQYDSF